MMRRKFLVGSMAALVTSLKAAQLAAANPKNVLVQIKVYRTVQPGIYESYPGIPVKLSNGMRGVTQAVPGMLGTWNSPYVSKDNYTGQAFINRRWVSGTHYQWINQRFLRIHVDLSKL